MNKNNNSNQNISPVNPALTNAINALQQCSDESKKQELINKLIEQISKASFILPAVDIQQTSKAVTRNNNTVIQPAARVELKLVKNGNGDAFFCGFTDENELAKAKMQNDKRIIQKFEGICEMLKVSREVSGFIINPLGKNVIITKQMCGFIAEMNGAKPEKRNIQNDKLKEAIAKMQEDGSPENVNKMVEETIGSTLIMPAKKIFAPDARIEGNGTLLIPRMNVNFMLMNYQNGNSFFGTFTDFEELKKWNSSDDVEYMFTDFDNLSNVVLNSNEKIKGFIINPNGKSVTFPKPMLHQIKQQRDYMKLENHTIKAGTKVQFSEPDEYPIDLMAALINHFSTEPEVNAAYLRLLNIEDGRKSFFIVVDFIGDLKSTFDKISEIAKPYIDDEIELTMMPYSMDFARSAVKDIEPFYKKSEE